MSEHPYAKTANEPKVHPVVRNSFAFVPSAGMRLAPEILVLELFREVFFEKHYESTGSKDLNPDEVNENKYLLYSQEERAVLYALRGRRKKTRNSRTQRFFAPAYPVLARASWLGKNRERVINNFLLGGPIAQHLWYRGPDVEEKRRERDKIIDLLCKALVGHNSVKEDEYRGKDILSAALRNTDFEVDLDRAKQNLVSKTGFSNSVIRINHDELSTRIFKDVRFICQLEKDLPRMQWLHVLMTFLRFSLPMWLLAQMRITSFLHEWLIDAIDNGHIVSAADIERRISVRNRGLLHPALTPTREVFERIEQYMKHRVELNILLYCLEGIRPDDIKGKSLDVRAGGPGKISVERLLEIAREASAGLRASDRFKDVAPGLDVRRFLTREGEIFPAWRSPLLKGQGKNIDEFLRVMYRAELGDEAGGYLLLPEGRGAGRGFRVFPGQLLLKTVTYLAARDKHSDGKRGGGGKLVLEDVENHFQQYGVDFSSAADARPLLMREMQAMGLLTGSPDAGSSVAVAGPY